jgi:hypothetical protein
MFVTVTLNSGYGISLGPRFFLIPDVGVATPAQANISELLAGKIIEVSDSTTQIQIVSNGICENSITLPVTSIPTTTTTTTAAPTTTTTTTAAPTTTTTTTAAPTTTTTTTTTAAPTTTTTTTTTTAAPTTTTTTTTTTTAAPTTTTTTTTAAPTTTTTTTAGVTYDYYYADQYDCLTCSFQQSNFIVAFIAGTVVSLNKWYGAADPDGNSYYITGTTFSGPGLIMLAQEFDECSFACFI